MAQSWIMPGKSYLIGFCTFIILLKKARPGAGLAHAWHMHVKYVLIIYKENEVYISKKEYAKPYTGLVQAWHMPGKYMPKSLLII